MMQLVPVLLSLTSIWQKHSTAPSICIGLVNIWRTSTVLQRSVCGQGALRSDFCHCEIDFFPLVCLLVGNNICSRLFGGVKESSSCRFL